MNQDTIDLVQCPVCDVYHDHSDDPSGICKECEEAGFWMDPIGTIHQDGDDPAAAYI